MSLNPRTQSNQDSEQAKRSAGVLTGFITSVKDDNRNIVSVQPVGQQTEIPMVVPIWAVGDIHIPTLDSPVEVYYMRTAAEYPIILGYQYTRLSDIPSYEAGERHISHDSTDTDIYFQNDGSLTIETAGGGTIDVDETGTISLNGGENGVIHDISTTTDGDGHVTDITLERRDDILV